MKIKNIAALLLASVLLFSSCAGKEEKKEKPDVKADQITDTELIFQNEEYTVTKGAFEYMYSLNFHNSIEPYADYYGFDLTQSLDTQYVDKEETQSLKEYICEQTKANIYNCILYACEAKDEGFEYPELEESVNETVSSLESEAKTLGMSTEEYLKSYFGADTTPEDVKNIAELQIYAYAYNDKLITAELEKMTEDDYSSYYEENDDGTLDTEPTRSVGHILISFDFYDSEDEAYAKAKEVLGLWKAGEMTKDSFEALSNEYNDDANCFYENVTKGQMVEEFENWLFDSSRAEGDTGIVKTVYGYHVMYFVSVDEPKWREDARVSYVNGKMTEYTKGLEEKYKEGIFENKDVKSLMPDIIPLIEKQ